MPIIHFTAEDACFQNDPWKSNTTRMRSEDAPGCNGTCEGGEAVLDPATGDFVSLRPHDHLIMTGEDPKAGPRYTAVYPPEEEEIK
jgi:hypothetical protein